MFDSGVSSRTVARSVDREGRRWRLHARTFRGKVKVCDEVHVARTNAGGMCDVTKTSRMLCTVDDEHPFSAALACRVRNGETNMAARYEAHDELVSKEEQAEAAQTSGEARAAWKNRRRVSFVGGMYLPPWAEREKRRIEEAQRRRGR